jgi:DNA-binding CsgD family transcriptional regulator
VSGRLIPPTERQLEVYRLKLGGMSWNAIASYLGITKATARAHFKRADEKLNEKEAA